MAQGIRVAAAKAEGWLERGLPHLAQTSCAEKIELRRLKALCEIGFLTALSPDHLGATALARAVLELTVQAAAGGRFVSALWHQPNHANLYLPMLFNLARHGRLDGRALADLTGLLGGLRAMGSERIPFRTLDFLFSDRLLTGAANMKRMDAVARFGCAPPDLSLASCSPRDEYGLTHSVFYMTSFGSRRWPLSVERRRRLALVLRAMRAAAERKQDWDLAAEFLAAGMMVGSAAEPAALARLVLAQNADGSWTGPADLEPALRAEGIADSDAAGFYSSYHTTLVAWMTLQMHTAPRCFRPAGRDRRSTGRPQGFHAYAGLPGEWRRLLGAFRRLPRGAGGPPPPRALLSDPQAVLPFLEYHHWRERLRNDRPVIIARDEAAPMMDAARHRRTWRELRCLLLMAGPQRLEESYRMSCLDSVLAALETAMRDGDAATGVDLLVCAGLLGAAGKGPGSRRATLTALAEKQLMIAVLERDLFAAGPVAAFLRPWIEPGLLGEARAMLAGARSRSLPYGFVFDADALELRRSLACATYIDQIQVADALGGSRRSSP